MLVNLLTEPLLPMLVNLLTEKPTKEKKEKISLSNYSGPELLRAQIPLAQIFSREA